MDCWAKAQVWIRAKVTNKNYGLPRLTFEGALGKDTKLRWVTYQLHRHTERRIEFQKAGQEVRNTELQFQYERFSKNNY